MQPLRPPPLTKPPAPFEVIDEDHILLVAMAISDPDFDFGVDPGRLRGCPLAHIAPQLRV
jgi:hypothetical protein